MEETEEDFRYVENDEINSDDYFSDWLADKKEQLRREFCEDREDEFMEFCRIVFKEEEDMR